MCMVWFEFIYTQQGQSPSSHLNLCLCNFQGCFQKVTKALESNLGIIAGISFGIAFFQVYIGI